MLSRRFATAFVHARHIVISLALAGLPLSSAIARPAPAHADHEPNRNPVARLELVVHRIIVHDDSEYFSWEEGEISIVARFWRVAEGCVPSDGEFWWYWESCRAPVAVNDTYFTADSGETVPVSLVVPTARGNDGKEPIGLGIGFPVYADRTYGFEIEGTEIDPAFSDQLGGLAGSLSAQNNWGLGRREERGWVAGPGFDPEPLAQDFCAPVGPPGPGSCGRPALFTAEYEIRRVPLPDLRTNTIRLLNADPLQFYCPVVENIGQQPSEVFQLSLTAGGTFQRTATLPPLEVGQTTENCVLRSDLPAGEAALSARIDPAREIAEMDETNNFYQWGISALPVPPSGGQMLMTPDGPRTTVVVAEPQLIRRPSAAQTEAAPTHDLEVEAIRVKGKEPSGNNDCDPGKNDVTVVVKNEGTAAAASLQVRLTVGNQTKETSATNLGAGKEVNVTFDDLMLTKGQHKLTATANVPNAAALSLQDDGKLEVNVNCADE